MQSRPAVATEQPSEQAAWAERNTEPSRWSLYTRSNYEARVASVLSAQSVETYVPTPARPGAGAAECPRLADTPIFPGYVFIHSPSRRRCGSPSRRRRGVVRIVGCGNEPTPIPDHEIESLRTVLAGAAGRGGPPTAACRSACSCRTRGHSPASMAPSFTSRAKPASPSNHRGASQPLGEHIHRCKSRRALRYLIDLPPSGAVEARRSGLRQRRARPWEIRQPATNYGSRKAAVPIHTALATRLQDNRAVLHRRPKGDNRGMIYRNLGKTGLRSPSSASAGCASSTRARRGSDCDGSPRL